MIYVSPYWYLSPIGIALLNFIIGSLFICFIHLLAKKKKLSKDERAEKIDTFLKFQSKLISNILPKVFIIILVCLFAYRGIYRIYEKVNVENKIKSHNISKLKNRGFNYYKITCGIGKYEEVFFIFTKEKLNIKEYIKINDSKIIRPNKIEKISFKAFINLNNEKINDQMIDFVIKGKYNETTI